jgi:hypothetical protein
MKITFKKLAEYMEKHETHVRVAGRTTDYIIPNSMEEGQHIMMTRKGSDEVAGDVEMDSPEEDDLMVEMDEAENGEDIEEGGELEVEDDGDLDIF